MDVFDRGKEVLVTLRDAIERAEPLIDVGSTLMESTTELVRDTHMLVRDTRVLVGKAGGTLEKCDAILVKGPGLADQLGALMKAHTELAELNKQRVALEIEKARGS